MGEVFELELTGKGSPSESPLGSSRGLQSPLQSFSPGRHALSPVCFNGPFKRQLSHPSLLGPEFLGDP